MCSSTPTPIHQKRLSMWYAMMAIPAAKKTLWKLRRCANMPPESMSGRLPPTKMSSRGSRSFRRYARYPPTMSEARMWFLRSIRKAPAVIHPAFYCEGGDPAVRHCYAEFVLCYGYGVIELWFDLAPYAFSELECHFSDLGVRACEVGELLLEFR